MKEYWIAEVKWKPVFAKGHGATRIIKTEYFGPFTEYDTGIKTWSSKFSSEHRGEVEHIDYHKLTLP